MQQLDRDVNQSSALVIDGNPTSRSVMLQHMRSFGFGTVKMATRILEARDMLEHRRFDVVLCDYHFENGEESGQDLLDELRREQMLPYSTVFVMVTGEATYAKVAEAAESALDSYLVKPFSANTLFERLKESRQRKRVLKPIFDALDTKNYEDAARLCLERFEKRELYWLYAARIGAELLMTLKRNGEARKLYDAVVEAKAVPWARLGVARTQLADGEVTQARRSLETLMAELPQYADTYDVMGKVQMEQGQLDEALETYNSAAQMTPGCILRLQHCGTLNFYAGDHHAAVTMLERTWALGSKSRLFDVLSMMLLAFLRFDNRDGKTLQHSYEVIKGFSDKYEQSHRLRRMALAADALVHLHAGKISQGIGKARELAGEANEPNFDMEAATNLLSLWSRIGKYDTDMLEYSHVAKQVARRFSVSKVATEVLVAAVQRKEEPAKWIRETHAEVMQTAEEAMNRALHGQPKIAVETLLFHGESTGNAKLIEMASLVANRHRERIEDVDRLIASAGTLTHRFCAPSTHIAGVRRSSRSAGGMVLRR